MKVFKLRQRLHQLGFILEQNQQGFIVNNDSVKTPFEKYFDNLEEVVQWVSEYSLKNNRMSEEECEQWDEDFKVFVLKQDEFRE